MTTTIRKFHKVPVAVDAAEYTGGSKNLKVILNWIKRHGGVAFEARELGWRHDFGTYHHKDHGFIYLPQGARSAGSPIQGLRDDELVVRTGNNTFAVVFPGDYVVRSRHGFYPLRAESFHRSYRANPSRRGTGTTAANPPPS